MGAADPSVAEPRTAIDATSSHKISGLNESRKRPAGFSIAAICVLSAFLLAGCQSSGGSGLDLPLLGGDDGERILDKVAEKADGNQLLVGPANPQPRSIFGIEYNSWMTVVEDDVLRDYVRSVAQKLAEDVPTLGGQSKEIDVFITSSPNLEAAATPTNDIYISLGALQRLENEDQLAFLLAHEMGHIVLDHFNREKVQEAQYRTSELVKFLGFVGQAFKNTDVDRVGQQVVVSTDDDEYAKNVRKIELMISAIQVVAEGIVDTAWTRRQESDADKIGVDIFTSAGYTASQLTPVFEEMIEDSLESSARTRQLIARLTKLAVELSTITTEEPWRQQLQAAAIEWSGKGAAAMMDRLSARHERVAKRNEDAVAYAVATSQSLPGRVKTEDYFDALNDTRSERIQGVIEQSWAAKAALQNHAESSPDDELLGDGLSDAIDLAKRAVGGRGGDLGYPRLTAFQMLQRGAGLESAIGELKAVRGNSESGPAVLMHLAVAHAELSQQEEAYSALDSLEATYDPATLFHLRSRVELTLREYDRAQETLSDCFTTGQRPIVLACENVKDEFSAQIEEDQASVEAGGEGLFQGLGSTIRQGFKDAGTAFNEIRTGGQDSNDTIE